MTNDDKVKLANEILALESKDIHIQDDDLREIIYCRSKLLKSIVSEWLQFTQAANQCRFITFDQQCRKPYGHDGYHEVNIYDEWKSTVWSAMNHSVDTAK
jgi:hypothetical protein